MKTLVAYFSAESGRTAEVAKALASAVGADLFEIRPEQPYSRADLNYMDPKARCNREHFGKEDVPVAGTVEGFAEYDRVLIGFPIWYGSAPDVVNCFCKAYDWSGKQVAAFATSGGSGIDKTAEKLKPFVPGAEVLDAKLFRGPDAQALKAWAEGL